MIKYLSIFCCGFLIVSCSAEKVSLSPVYESLSSSQRVSVQNYPDKFTDKTSANFYASELINQMSTFPDFENAGLDREVETLKYNVRQYVYALQEYNIVGQQSYLNKVEKSYKNIQKMRKFLNADDDQIINRYLVRIKSNIAQIESLKPADSLSAN